MSTRTRGHCSWVVGLMVFAQVASASDPIRLEGLDRLYFERVAWGSRPLPAPDHVTPLLPSSLQEPVLETRKADGPASAQELTIRDFELPWPGKRAWIREVTDHTHPRIHDSWWALYDNGRRSDVWKFAAFPDRTDKKILTNYRLDSITAPAGDTILVRVRGEMARPGGGWTVAGKEWTFAVGEAAMTLKSVRNTFTVIQSDTLWASTERNVGDRIEVRQLDDVSEDIAARCHLGDPVGDDTWQFSWEPLVAAATCITSEPAAKVTSRDPQAPSFIERSSSK